MPQAPASPVRGRDQNSRQESDLPADRTANFARNLSIPPNGNSGPGVVEGVGPEAFRIAKTAENTGLDAAVRPESVDRRPWVDRPEIPVGTSSASRVSAMDFHRPTVPVPTPPSDRPESAAAALVASPFREGSESPGPKSIEPKPFEANSSWQPQVVPVAEATPASASPASPEASASRQVNQRLQDLLTGEAVLFQRLRNGSMTAVLRPEPGSELRVELRRRQGGVEIRATVERGDSRAIADGWQELQQQLRGQGIVLHALERPTERESAPPTQRNLSDPGGDRSSQSGGRGRQQGSAETADSSWTRGQSGSGEPAGSADATAARTSGPARSSSSSQRLLESWA
jgi:hypothetical protein